MTTTDEHVGELLEAIEEMHARFHAWNHSQAADERQARMELASAIGKVTGRATIVRVWREVDKKYAPEAMAEAL